MWYHVAIVTPVELARWVIAKLFSDAPNIYSFSYQDQHVKIRIKFSMLAGTVCGKFLQKKLPKLLSKKRGSGKKKKKAFGMKKKNLKQLIQTRTEFMF